VKSGYQGAVVDLAWGTASPDVLVALILPATLRFVNATTGAVMRTYSLAQGAVMAGICANRYDHSCFALTSAAGSLVVATVKDPNGTVEAQEVSLRETGPRSQCSTVQRLTDATLCSSLHNCLDAVHASLCPINAVLCGLIARLYTSWGRASPFYTVYESILHNIQVHSTQYTSPLPLRCSIFR
jgi:hypothetical protein